MNPAPPASVRPRVALVGISGYGGIHLQLLRARAAVGSLRLTAVVAIDAAGREAGLAAELRGEGCAVYPSLGAMLASEKGRLELVVLPTPIHLHRPMTEAALRAGCSVLVEKPLAGTVAEGTAIMTAARAPNRFVAVGFQELHAPEVTALKSAVLNGALGALHRIRCCVRWPRNSSYYTRNDWAGRLVLGDDVLRDSPLNNAMAHFFMLALYFAGRELHSAAEPISMSAELYRAQPIESFDTADVWLRDERGVEIRCIVTHSGASETSAELQLEGDRGCAIWRQDGDCELVDAEGCRRVLGTRSTHDGRDHLLDAVLARLRDPARFVCPPELALVHTRVIEALHRHVPIHPVSDSFLVREAREPAGVQTMIHELDALLDQAVATGAPLHELGAAWTRPATLVKLAPARDAGRPAQSFGQGPDVAPGGNKLLTCG